MDPIDTAKNRMAFGPACHETHKELQIPGALGIVRGGNARSAKDGFDVYVDLDSKGQIQQAPWRSTPGVVKVRYEIANYRVPADPETFKAFIDWLCTQVHAGKRVHIGCIGGHGRTGLVIAALYKQLTGDKDAITWVRKNHCHKAVETNDQVAFLVKHFGCNDTGPARYGNAGSTGHQKSLFPR